MKKSPVQKATSIQSILLVTFIALLLVTVIGIGGLVFFNWRNSIKEETTEISAGLNFDVAKSIDQFVSTQIKVSELGYKLIKNDDVDFLSSGLVDELLSVILRVYNKDIYSFEYAFEDGRFYGVYKDNDGKLEIIKADESTGGEAWAYEVKDNLTVGPKIKNYGYYNAKEKEWYKTAVAAETGTFSPVSTTLDKSDLAISATYPIYNEDHTLQGVFATSVRLAGLNNYLFQSIKDHKGYSIILEEDSNFLIANSMETENYSVSADGNFTRKVLQNLDSHVFQSVYEKYQATGQTNFVVEDDLGNDWHTNVYYYSQRGLKWLIISVVPDMPLFYKLQKNIAVAALLVCFAAILSIAIYKKLIKRLFKPMESLQGATNEFSAGHLDSRAPVKRNDEVGRLAVDFNNLAAQLQQTVLHLEDMVEQRTQEVIKANENSEERRQQLQLILDSTAEAIFGTDLNGICTFCNLSCLHVLRYNEPEDLLGKNMLKLICHSDKNGKPRHFDEGFIDKYLNLGTGNLSQSSVLWRADGTCFDAEYRALPQYKNGRQLGFVITFMDVTERKRKEEKIMFLSCHDLMTGLLNRGCFEQKVRALDTELNLPISIIFIDLNGLKMVNDTFGHTAGDELILKAAELLKTNCRKQDVFARVGGDEFMIFLPQTTEETALGLGHQLQEKFSKEKVNVISCSLALGVSVKERAAQPLELVMEIAENKMYHEKSASARLFGSNAVRSIITALHRRSPREKSHSEEVSRLCEKIAQALNLSENRIKKARDAGYMHDIGKISLPDEILKKDGKKLTLSEKERMYQHSATGFRILNLSQDTLDLAPGVYAHHENWDGTGYPKGLKGEEIPITSRIIAVAEAYERIVGEAKNKEEGKAEALTYIQKNRGIHFDPMIVDAFLKVIKQEN